MNTHDRWNDPRTIWADARELLKWAQRSGDAAIYCEAQEALSATSVALDMQYDQTAPHASPFTLPTARELMALEMERLTHMGYYSYSEGGIRPPHGAHRD